MNKICPKHGACNFKFEKQSKKGYARWRCLKCSSERQIKSHKNTKIKLVMACGGKCNICGYDRCMSAMEFHHLDRDKKEFQISRKSFSFDRKLEEAKKCLLVCCRCHREIEAGMVSVV